MRPPPQPQILDQASTEQAAPKGAGTTGTRYSGQRKFLGVPQETVDRQCEEDEADGAVDGSQYQLSIDISESGRRYVEPDGIYAQLRCNLGAEANVKLLKWSWLDARAREMQSVRSDEERRRLALPRRQDIEATDQGAFYSSAEIAALPRGNMSWAGGPLAVVAVSYCWETPSHPDPEGRTLLSIARAIRRAQQQHIGRHHERLPAELGIFLDWCRRAFESHPSAIECRPIATRLPPNLPLTQPSSSLIGAACIRRTQTASARQAKRHASQTPSDRCSCGSHRPKTWPFAQPLNGRLHSPFGGQEMTRAPFLERLACIQVRAPANNEPAARGQRRRAFGLRPRL